MLPQGIIRQSICALGFLLPMLLAGRAAAELFEGFETPETSWSLSESDCAVQLIDHRRTFQVKYQGQGSEFVALRGGTGTYSYLTHSVPSARIIKELSPSVWINSDRPGLQLMLRVVLPRTPVGTEGQVLKTLLRGDIYTDVGNWQRLALTNLPLLMSRELAMLRTQFGPQVDAREAYADLVVLNAYGGAGTTRVWIDNLSVAGIAQAEVTAIRPDSPAAAGGAMLPHVPTRQALAAQGAFAASEPTQRPTAAMPMPQTRMEFQGDLLSVDGRPRFVRAIEHRGEEFEFLQSLGFNAIRLGRPATDEEVRKAEELGIWLIGPPPRPIQGHEIGSQGSVLVWDAGEGLAQRDLEAARQWISQTRAADPLRRPVLTMPRESLAGYSRISDIVALHPGSQAVVAGDMELSSYRPWLEQRRRLLRPGMACWAVLPTQLPLEIVAQWRAFDPGAAGSDALEPQQLHLLAYQALSAGARGLLFTSRSRLDDANAAATLRAVTLQCLNQQLSLLEPWVAGGDLSQEFEVHDPALSVAVLKTERSVLAILTKCGPAAQYVAPPMTPRPVSLVMRGVPASAHAYAISPIGLSNLRAAREGGMRIELESFRHSAVVMITQDPLVINHLTQEIRQVRRTAARTRRELVARQMAMTAQTLQQSGSRPTASGTQASNFEQAEAYLRRSELLLDAGDDRSSVGAAAESLEFLAAVRRDAWQAGVQGFPSPTSSPVCVSFAALPLHERLIERLKQGQWGQNQLPGGDVEDLGFLQSTGWDQRRTPADDVATLVELTPQAPHGGRFSLRMAAMPVDAATSRLVLESPAVEVQSAPVQLWAGQIVQIRGWAKVRPAALSETTVLGKAPLLVFDSIAGEALGQQVIADDTWREFVLYRAATEDAPVTVTLSLRSYGDAIIDDIQVIPLENGSPFVDASLRETKHLGGAR